jgi:hypothetical protein
MDLQVSMDGGKTFQSARAQAPIQVNLVNPGSGTSGMFENHMVSMSFTVPLGTATIQLRASQTQPSRGATQIDPQPDGTFRISSFFDVFTELSLDGGTTWSGTTSAPVRMQLTSQAPEMPAPSSSIPVTNAPYISPAQWHALYANGIYISNVTHRAFTQTYPPPPPGGTSNEKFGSAVDVLFSEDGGHTFTPAKGNANVTVQVTSRDDLDSNGTRIFDTEMTQLDISGGNLPGIMIRESPSKQSLGRTSIRPDNNGGFHVSSFFDVFTEVSTDGGNTWSPSTTPPAMMSPRLAAHKRIFPNPNLPPTNGQYISPKAWHAYYANGVIISNVTHRRFLANFQPPGPNGTNTHNFGSQVNFMLSLGSGQPFMPISANADCLVTVASSGFQSVEQVFQTEMASLNISGGNLPPGVMVRESPSKRSLGETHFSGSTGNYRISSFFDIFTEVSLDGGNTWSPASAPGYMELHIDPGVPPTTLLSPMLQAGRFSVGLQSQLGLAYVLQYKDNITDPTWTTLTITSGNGLPLTLTDASTSGVPHRFYRVQVQEDDSQ